MALASRGRAGPLSACLNLSHFSLRDNRVTLLVGPEQLRIAWKPEQPAALPLCVCAVLGGAGHVLSPPMGRPAAAGILGAQLSPASCLGGEEREGGGNFHL